MKKVILIAILMIVLLGAAFYIGTQTNKEVEYIETVIDLTDSEKKQVEQDARLNWIPLDSAWTLAESMPLWDIKDSTRWSFKDSTRWNIKDSTAITYIPYFEAEDTIVNFDEIDSLKQIRVRLSLAVKPRYFPTYQKFLTDVQMRELIITQPEHVDSWWKHRWIVYAGYGIGYMQMPATYEQPTQWCWSHGFQLGLGIRLY